MKKPMVHNREHPVSIYDYFDYRQFLKDFTEFKRRSDPRFNLRDFAKEIGLKSPGLIQMIYKGKRKITTKTREAFAKGFEIQGKEKVYFNTLIDYNHENDPVSKTALFDALLQLRPKTKKYTLEKRYFRYLTKDYYVTIREMVLLDDFCEDYDWIANRCAPPITATEAKEAVEELLDLKLLSRDKNGRLKQEQGLIETGANAQALEAYHFHQAVLSKAKASLGFLEQEKRSYQSLTITLPRKQLPEIVEKYMAFRDWIVAKSDENLGDKEVFHINFQLFPATWKGKTKKSE